MAKQIKSLVIDPPMIHLTDKPVSVLVDPDNGNILLTEGGGDDRMNSAYLPARHSPRFVVTTSGDEHQLEVHCRDFRWPVGTTADEAAAREWAAAANAVLAGLSNAAIPETPNPTDGEGRRLEATPAVSDSEKYA